MGSNEGDLRSDVQCDAVMSATEISISPGMRVLRRNQGQAPRFALVFTPQSDYYHLLRASHLTCDKNRMLNFQNYVIGVYSAVSITFTETGDPSI